MSACHCFAHQKMDCSGLLAETNSPYRALAKHSHCRVERQFSCSPEQSATHKCSTGHPNRRASGETGTAVDAACLDFSKAEDTVCQAVLKARLLRHHGLASWARR